MNKYKISTYVRTPSSTTSQHKLKHLNLIKLRILIVFFLKTIVSTNILQHNPIAYSISFFFSALIISKLYKSKPRVCALFSFFDG